MKRYEKYITIPSKVSPEMPESWTAKKLKFVLSYSKGKQPSQLTEEPVGDPYATMDYLRGRDCMLQYPVSTVGLVHIDNDSLLVLWDGANAGEFFRGKAGYLGSTMAEVKAGEQMDKTYLFYLLKGSETLSKMIAGGTTIPHFSPSFFDEIVAIPSLDEQQKIAAFLDYKTRKIDRLTEMLTARIDDLKKYRQSVISEAVIHGIDSNAVMVNCDINGADYIPIGWEITKLKYVISRLESGVSVNGESYPAGDSELGVLKTSCVYNRTFDAKQNKKVVEKDLSRVGCPVKGGTIIVSRMNTSELVGACGYVEKDYPNIFLPDRLWQIHFTENVDAKFLSYIINSSYVSNYFAALSVGSSSSMQNLSQEIFGNTIVALPSLIEQREITAYIDCKTKQIDDTIAATDQQLKDLQAYRASLISEAVTGQIDVRDWTAPEE